MLNTQGKVLLLLAYSAIFIQFTSCIAPGRQLPTKLNEVSGMVLHRDSLLLLNDGGNPAALYSRRLSPGGKRIVRDQRNVSERPVAVPNVDWEALTALDHGGDAARLCICDIGDNLHARPSVAFIWLAGPSVPRTVVASYPDFAHNAEACFTYRDSMYVLTKAEVTRRPKLRQAYLYRVPSGGDSVTMELVDSLALSRRSVTDAAVIGDNTLAVLSYDYHFLGPFPLTATSLYTLRLTPAGRFDTPTLTQKHVRAPFTLTQYESIAPADPDHVFIASERTLVIPARWRRVSLPEQERRVQP